MAYDKYPNYAKAAELGVKMVSLEDILQKSDIISLHLPSNQETRNLIDCTLIEKMKDGVYIINTSRGDIIDEHALLKGVKSGKIKGAALDVYRQEPMQEDNPLRTLDNVICTSHIGGNTVESFELTSMVTAQAIIDVFAGKTPLNRLT